MEPSRSAEYCIEQMEMQGEMVEIQLILWEMETQIKAEKLQPSIIFVGAEITSQVNYNFSLLCLMLNSFVI